MSLTLIVGLRDKSKDINAPFEVLNEPSPKAADIGIIRYSTTSALELDENILFKFDEWSILCEETLHKIQSFYNEQLYIKEQALNQCQTRYLQLEGLLLHAATDVAYTNIDLELSKNLEEQSEIKEQIIGYHHYIAEWLLLEEIASDNKSQYDLVYYLG